MPRNPAASPEIAAVISRILIAMRDVDLGALANLHSTGRWFRSVGTDENELWDFESFLPVVATQLEELPPDELRIDHVEGYSIGDVGWGMAVFEVDFPNGMVVPMRYTATLAIEDGVWRCVQSHYSIAVPSEHAIGVALTQRLEGLLDSIEPDTLDPVDAAEGTTTILFTDIEDSTRLATDMGDRVWNDLIAEHDQIIASLVRRFDGRVVKTLGDGALITFAGVRPALRFAIRVQEAANDLPYRMRIGIHTGDVRHTGGDVIGTTVNKAARVAAAAAGGQVVVSSIVHELSGAPDEFGFEEPFLAELKGLPGTHELRRLTL
jgi:class 3 adenylate cyclase